MKKEKLYIPVNVVESKDFISGFGSKELTILLIGAAIDLIIIFAFSAIFGSLTAILLGVVIISCLVICIKRDRFNESLVDKVRIAYQFSKVQKKYMYQYFDMYSLGEDKDA